MMAQMKPALAASPRCGPLNSNWLSELGFNPPLKCLMILTPCSSALLKYTIKVDKMTDITGEIAGNQNNFMFLFPWNVIKLIIQRPESDSVMAYKWLINLTIYTYYESGNEDENKEGTSNNEI